MSGQYINQPLLGAGQVQWRVIASPVGTTIRTGLATDANKASDAEANFAFAMEYRAGHLYIYEPGNGWTNNLLDLGVYAINIPLAIDYDGININYIANGTIVRTKTTAENQVFYGKSLSDGSGPAIDAFVAYAPTQDARWSGIIGNGRPADNADVTSANTAAGITGQGALATRDNILASMLPRLTPGTNLISDSQFDDLTSFNLFTSGTSGVPIKDTSVSAELLATSSIKFTPFTGGASSGPRVEPRNAIQAKAGDTFRASCTFKVLTGFNGELRLGFYPIDATGSRMTVVWLDLSTVDKRTVAATTTYTGIITMTGIGVLPAGAIGVMPVVMCSWGANAPAGALWVSNWGFKMLQALNEDIAMEDGTTPLTDAAAVTSLGTAGGIAGQSLWATYTTVTPTTMVSQTQNLDINGRIVSVAGYQPNRNYGLRSTNSPPIFTDTWVAGTPNTVTINIGASTLTADTGASISLPSGTITGCLPGTKYYIYRNMTDPLSAAGSYAASTVLNDALAPTKVYLGYWTTRATSGTSGGGGTVGNPDCVSPDAWLNTEEGPQLAKDVKPGTRIFVLNEKTFLNDCLEEVTHNRIGMNDKIKLTTENGISLTLALNTPLTLGDGSTIVAVHGLNECIPVRDENGFRWERIINIEAAGYGEVSHISCNGKTFAAGDSPDKFIFTHNIQNKS